mgnify:CR=1 FL=1
MAEIQIIKASPERAYSIGVLTKIFFPYIKLSLDAIKQRLDSSTVEYYVALRGGATIGFIDLEFQEDCAKILGLCVVPEFQGTGVGTRLIETAVGRAKEKNYEKIFLLVEENNALAIRLYEKLGFSRQGALAEKLWGKKILLLAKKLR